MDGELRPGDRIGRYTIEESLGRGGMGEVYRARDDVLRRSVAVKILPREAAYEADSAGGQRDSVARMLREARLAAALQHPNVVAVFDVGQADLRPFIVMELVVGRSLRSFVGADVPFAERLRWIAEVAKALAAAHGAGLVHRDIKPENVMLSRDGTIKVLDFGIARRSRVEAGDETGTSITAGDLVAGTPGYIAPELMVHGVFDARSDQFSWGALTYELFTGRLPWPANGVGKMLRAFAEGKALSLEDPLPAPIEPIVRRALDMDPDHRFPTMDALLEALVGPPSAPPPMGADIGSEAATVAEVPATAVIGAGDTAVLRTGGAPRRANRALIGALMALVMGIALLALGRAFEPSKTSPSLELTNVRRLTDADGCEEFPSFTNDGSALIYDATDGPDTHIFRTELATGRRTALTQGSGWQYAPALSPDESQLAFLEWSTKPVATYVMPLDGSGAPRHVISGRIRPSFTPDGRSVWAGERELVRVDLATLEVQQRLAPPGAGTLLRALELADGRVAAIFEGIPRSTGGLLLYPRGGGEPTWLARGRMSEVLALDPRGDALLASIRHPGRSPEIIRAPLTGDAMALVIGAPQATAGLRFSPDLRTLAWSTCAARAGLRRIVEVEAELRSVPLFEDRPADEDWPIWLAGTREILLLSDRGDSGEVGLWVLDWTGAHAPRELPIPGGVRPRQLGVSMDGQNVAILDDAKSLFAGPLDGSRPVRRVIETRGAQSPTFSSDGTEIIYTAIDEEEHHVKSISLAGGQPRTLADGPSRAACMIPARNAMFHLGGPDGAPRARLLHLETGDVEDLGVEIEEGYLSVASPDGSRVMVVAHEGLTEIDLDARRIVRRFASAPHGIRGFTYAEDQLIIGLEVWSGSVWLAGVE